MTTPKPVIITIIDQGESDHPSEMKNRFMAQADNESLWQTAATIGGALNALAYLLQKKSNQENT